MEWSPHRSGEDHRAIDRDRSNNQGIGERTEPKTRGRGQCDYQVDRRDAGEGMNPHC